MKLVDMALQLPVFDSNQDLDHLEIFAGDMSVTHGERKACFEKVARRGLPSGLRDPPHYEIRLMIEVLHDLIYLKP